MELWIFTFLMPPKYTEFKPIIYFRLGDRIIKKGRICLLQMRPLKLSNKFNFYTADNVLLK